MASYEYCYLGAKNELLYEDISFIKSAEIGLLKVNP